MKEICVVMLMFWAGIGTLFGQAISVNGGAIETVAVGTFNRAFGAITHTFVGVGPVTIEAEAVIGHGGAERRGLARIIFDGENTVTLHIDTEPQAIDETFTRLSGVIQCTFNDADPTAKGTPKELCGTVAPWFFPFPFLGHLRSPRFAISNSSNSQISIFSIQHIPLRSVQGLPVHNAPTVLIFNAGAVLSNYKYSLPLRSVGGVSPTFLITYEDYRLWHTFSIPYKIHQSIDDQTVIDLTITSISAGPRP